MSRTDTLPRESRLNDYRAPGDYIDTFSVSLRGRPDLQEVDMRILADHALNAEIGWMKALLAMRDRIFGPLGLKTTDALVLDQENKPISCKEPGDRIGFFKIYSIAENEIVLGEDDWHQDFRLALSRQTAPRPRFFASTCCKRHNIFGYAYLALIIPFHRKIAKTVLDTAVTQGLQPLRTAR